MVKAEEYRLPKAARPERYTLKLRPFFGDFTFKGELDVDVAVSEPVKSIVLNAAELKVSRAELRLPGGGILEASKIDLDKGKERLKVSFDKTVPKGKAVLHLTFDGVLNDRLLGFYRSKYTTADGKEGYMAVTQFESTDARRAFPCWDEPDMKATFRLSLAVPDGMAAVSNTPIILEENIEGEGARVVQFAETPRMSTYLLAFIVGPLEAIETMTAEGTRVGVWATPDKVQYGQWALENAARVLDYLNDYYGIPYPLAKLDHIALSDFAAGAMENWGAITYRERLLLLDPATSSAQTRQGIVDVMAHETAHMWFGDLVTMSWWDDLWLNESFATWMGTKAVDALHPDWQMWTQFLYLDAVRGMALDGLKSSHPIEVEVRNPAEIQEIFDEVSYSKGASILWMLEQYLGEKQFRRGLRDYLETHSYANARTKDLWKAIEKASGQPVSALMDTWVKQTGLPFLEATVERKGGEATVTLSQSRFLYEHILGESDKKALWKVPVRIGRAGGADLAGFLMENSRASISLGVSRLPPAKDWIKVNAGHSGFYRVNYPPEEWERLTRAVEALELPPRDRLGLQNDAYALMLAGYLPASKFLEITAAYRQEEDATVWRAIAESLHGFETLIADQPFLNQLHRYGKRLFQPVAEKAGWDAKPGEGHLEALRRTTVLSRAGYYGDENVIEEAMHRFDRYIKAPDSLHPNLRDAVYGLAAQEGDESLYETLWDLERKATLNEEKVRLLVALTRPKRKKLLKETLERSLSDEVRSQDAVIVIGAAATSRPSLGRDPTWSFIMKNWEELERRYAGAAFLIRRLVRVSDSFTSLEKAQEVEKFFKAHPVPEVKRAVRQSLERIRVNSKWLELNEKDLANWFSDHA